MKKLTFALLILLCPLLLKADNWLENGDFADGIDHWHGEGQTPAAFSNDNPLDKPDPLMSKGLIFPLKPSNWKKAWQDFRGKLSSGVMTVTYMVSPDLVFSTKPEDYKNVPNHIGYNEWKSFDVPQGNWVIFLSDFGSLHGTIYPVPPQGTPGTVQTFKAPVSGLTPMEDKTITLTFPPGKVTIVILSVSIDDK